MLGCDHNWESVLTDDGRLFADRCSRCPATRAVQQVQVSKPVICECGREGRLPCERCAWLDGSTDSSQDIISAIRRLDMGDGMTVYDVADDTGLCTRQALRVLRVLEARGRVRRWDPPLPDACAVYRLNTPQGR